MPELDRRLHTLQQAALLFRATPGRKGRVVALQDVTEVLVAGDIHGHVDNFRRLLALADLAKHPRRHFVLQEVIHGPFRYSIGGDKSHQLLDLVAALKCQFPRQVHFLMGNHELAQATQRRIGKDEDNLLELFDAGVKLGYAEKADAVFAAYKEIFLAAPFALRTPNRVFLSHSLPPAARLAEFDPAVLERDVPEVGDVIPGGVLHSLVWGRDTRLETVAAFLRKVDADLLITGHIPCDDGYEAPNDRQLILDCMGTPACYCLFPADRPLTHAELLACVKPLDAPLAA
jgi:Calcineurin-like phosphoesterase